MDPVEKLRLTGRYMDSEVTDPGEAGLLSMPSGCPSVNANTCEKQKNDATDPGFWKDKSLPIEYVALPGGRRIPLLKTALTTACERNCTYCAFRCGRDFERQTLSPDEMAKAFMQLYKAGIVQGLFVSSAMAGGGVRTQDRLLDCADLLRNKYQFKGYVHLKIMPGAEKDQVIRGMQLADRVSVNLESPTIGRLKRLAPQKQFLEELVAPLKWVDQVRREMPAWRGWNGKWPSSATQFVVGAIDETDLELLQMTSFLHGDLRLARVYYSGFSPVPGTPLENEPALDPWRKVRLYQSGFLLRDYGFDFEELEFTQNGFLPLDTDPKVIWANHSLRECPVEINKADYHQLIRVPGIGPVNAKKILAQRKIHSIQSEDDLHRIGVYVSRAVPFILLNGRRPAYQLPLQFDFLQPGYRLNQ